MRDIKIKDNQVVYENGDWVLVDGINRILQNIRVALYTLKNDWLLDYTKGIAYFDNLKSLNDNLLKADIKRAVREVEGVDRITKFVFKRVGVNISVTITVLINGEEQTISEGFYYGNN